MEKACINCGAVKPATAFWRQKSRRDGLFGECKDCARQRNNAWYRANAETQYPRINAIRRRQRLANPMAEILKSIRHRSALRGIECTITLADIPMPTHCPVLGIPLRSRMGVGPAGRTKGWRDNSPSVDRIDPSRGYTPDNVIVVSQRANRIKNDASVDELYRIADFYRDLANGRARKSEGSRSEPEGTRLPAAMP